MVEPALESKVAKYIIKNAPYGEEKFVLEDLAKLLEATSVSDPSYLSALKDNAEEHLAIFQDTENGKRIILSKHNFEDGFYVDQKANEKFSVNYLERKIKDVEPFSDPVSGGLKELRDEVDKNAEAYVKAFYRDDVSLHLVHASGDDSAFTLQVLLTGKFLNLNNLYTGQWSSEWTVTKGSIAGHVKIDAHYFEDGNIQLKQSKDFQTTYEHGDNHATNGKKIIDAIRACEDKVIAGLDQVYESMTENAFKYMRKPLPITKSKMEWNISVQKVIGSMKNK